MERRLRRVCLLGALAVQAGCAVHAVGLVTMDGDHAAVLQSDGSKLRLALGPDSRPLEGLWDHFVEIDGRRVMGKVQVAEWRVLEGPHGLATWVGPVVGLGVQIGIEDHTSGALYFVDDEAARRLAPLLGEVVAVEGYVDGPHRVHVLHTRHLAGTAPPG